MKLKYIKTFIFLMIFVVFAAGCIYNYMKRPAEAPEIIRFFDKNAPSDGTASGAPVYMSDPGSAESESADPAESAEVPDGLININTASQSELETLPGIGPVKAKAIIEYRRSYKGFVAKEEIMEVRGIGPATYEKIKDRITLE